MADTNDIHTVEVDESELGEGKMVDVPPLDPNAVNPVEVVKERESQIDQASVIERVRQDREERGAKDPVIAEGVIKSELGQALAFINHPPEFTEAEDVEIVKAMMARLPLYAIANRIRCSRSCLFNHIQKSRLLSEAWNDSKESFVDLAEYQADRLIQAGNPAMVMFALERRGKDRGWSQQDTREVVEDDTRIIIGEIPEEDIAAAEKEIEKIDAKAAKKAAKDASVKTGVEVTGEVGAGDPMDQALQAEQPHSEPYSPSVQTQSSPQPPPPIQQSPEPVPWDTPGGDDFMFGGGGFGDDFGGF